MMRTKIIRWGVLETFFINRPLSLDILVDESARQGRAQSPVSSNMKGKDTISIMFTGWTSKHRMLNSRCSSCVLTGNTSNRIECGSEMRLSIVSSLVFVDGTIIKRDLRCSALIMWCSRPITRSSSNATIGSTCAESKKIVLALKYHHSHIMPGVREMAGLGSS